jgi:hypothetical protein
VYDPIASTNTLIYNAPGLVDGIVTGPTGNIALLIEEGNERKDAEAQRKTRRWNGWVDSVMREPCRVGEYTSPLYTFLPPHGLSAHDHHAQDLPASP